MYFPEGAFAELANKEAGYWWFRVRNKIILWVLKNKVPKFSTFLEIGCGTGFVLSAVAKTFPAVKLFGGEYYPEAFVYAGQRVPSASFRQLDALNFEVAEQCEVIGLFDVLEHIPQDGVALKNIHRAVAKGGHLFITVPQHPQLWSAVDEISCHVRRYSREDLKRKLEEAGFEPVYMTSFVFFLMPLMYLSRCFGKKEKSSLKNEPQVGQGVESGNGMGVGAGQVQAQAVGVNELAIPKWLNFILESIAAFEFWLLQLGVKFPVGGSLLCLAKKSEG